MACNTETRLRRFRLSELNRWVSRRWVTWILAAAVLFTAFRVYLTPLVKTGKIEGTPRSGDGPDYDALAVQLAKGNGFSVDANDPEYKRPYRKTGQPEPKEDAAYQPQPSLRTSRPPLLPVVMAVSFKVFGRQFAPVRVITCLMMATAAAGAFLLLAQRFGVAPGLIAAWWFIADRRTQTYARMILTEAPAALAVVLMTWCLVRTCETRSPRWAAGLGLAMALGFYTRSVIVLWVPVIVVLVYLLARPKQAAPVVAAVCDRPSDQDGGGHRPPLHHRIREFWRRRPAAHLPAIAIGVFLALAGPWMLRNCVVLRRFEPFGTMGSSSFAAAYSDQAMQKRGIWFNLTRAGFFNDVVPADATPLERERLTSDYSKRKAWEWIRQNPSKLPLLAWHKIQGLWRLPAKRSGPTFLLISAGLGALAMLGARPRQAACYLGMLVACTLAVAVTWSVGGRFLVPVLPIVSLFAGLGVWSALVAATELAAERLTLGRGETGTEA